MSFFWWGFTCCSECWDCLLREYANNVFCVLSRNVRCDLRNAIQICLLQKLSEWFVLVIMLDHLIVSFFWSSSSTFSEWRMPILDYQVTYACPRLSSDVCLFSICRAASMMRHRAWWSISSKWDDSSNLTKATHQTWRKETSSHQSWRRRHLIKFEIVVSSNFWEERQFSTFWWAISCSDTWCEELSFAEDHFRFVRK
jgi:hypothetical protein